MLGIHKTDKPTGLYRADGTKVSLGAGTKFTANSIVGIIVAAGIGGILVIFGLFIPFIGGLFIIAGIVMILISPMTGMKFAADKDKKSQLTSYK